MTLRGGHHGSQGPPPCEEEARTQFPLVSMRTGLVKRRQLGSPRAKWQASPTNCSTVKQLTIFIIMAMILAATSRILGPETNLAAPISVWSMRTSEAQATPPVLASLHSVLMVTAVARWPQGSSNTQQTHGQPLLKFTQRTISVAIRILFKRQMNIIEFLANMATTECKKEGKHRRAKTLKRSRTDTPSTSPKGVTTMGSLAMARTPRSTIETGMSTCQRASASTS